MSDDLFHCKECGHTGDYHSTRKAMDPRPNVRRVICGDCVDRINKHLSRAQAFDGFGGVTYDPVRDRERLGKQMVRVIEAMLDGQWRSLEQIKKLTGDPEASISARLRDIRKIYHPGAMEHRRQENGLWLYRVLLTDREAA